MKPMKSFIILQSYWFDYNFLHLNTNFDIVHVHHKRMIHKENIVMPQKPIAKPCSILFARQALIISSSSWRCCNSMCHTPPCRIHLPTPNVASCSHGSFHCHYWGTSRLRMRVGGISNSWLTRELMYWCRSMRSSAFCCRKPSVSVISLALSWRVSLFKFLKRGKFIMKWSHVYLWEPRDTNKIKLYHYY